MKSVNKLSGFIFIVILFVFLPYSTLSAHCDGVDGPVIKAAVKALETENVNLVLIWIQPEDETVIKEQFNKTLKVRKLNNDAKELADNYFFETLVRLHRAGEGEPYTGVKPAGVNPGPVVLAADKSIDEGSIEKLKHLFEEKQLNSSRLDHMFSDLIAKKNFNVNDVKAGRDFVNAYVKFMHTAEELYGGGNTNSHDHKTEKHH